MHAAPLAQPILPASPAGTWQQLPGTAAAIALSPSGHLWACTAPAVASSCAASGALAALGGDRGCRRPAGLAEPGFWAANRVLLLRPVSLSPPVLLLLLLLTLPLLLT